MNSKIKKLFEKMIKGIYLINILLISSNIAYSQFFNQNSRSLFSDVKAYRVGDALTVLIMEDTHADNAASSSESRNTDLKGGVNASGGSTNFQGNSGINTGNTFKGQGANSRTESLRSKLSVRVTEVDANGNLKIQGNRKTKVNGETQNVIISGLVRPVDILSDNTIYSYNIMDLNLNIEGKGNITDSQEPGYITKFLRILF